MFVVCFIEALLNYYAKGNTHEWKDADLEQALSDVNQEYVNAKRKEIFMLVKNLIEEKNKM